MNKTITEIIKNIIEIVSFANESLALSNGLDNKDQLLNSPYIKEKMNSTNKLYLSLTNTDKLEFYNILNTEFEQDSIMHIYLLSILLYCVHTDEIIERITDIIINSNINIYKSVLLEFLIAYEIFRYSDHGDLYQLRRRLHSYNVKKYCNSIEISRNFIPYENRNKNRIVVITEQLLGLNHAPSKMILEQCYELEKNLGMEVFLITSPIRNSYIDELIWFDSFSENRLSYLDGNYIAFYEDGEIFYKGEELNDEFIIVYKNIPIRGRQLLFEENNIEELKMLINKINKFNPLFVYDMGSIHPLADACNSFTTVVSMSMGYGYPVSDAPILLSLNKNGESQDDRSIISILDNNNQVVLNDKFIFSLDKPTNPHNRAQYGLSKNVFLIAIVGNRLDAEITTDFIGMLRHVMLNDNEIEILLIGKYPNYETYFIDAIFKDRVHFMGWQEDFANFITISNIFLNPPRKGGGTSALIALSSGVPVITLSEGDVAGNVGADFICKDYKEMEAVIKKYKQDKEFYKDQSIKGINYTHKKTDLTGNLKNNLNRIEETILMLEGKL